MLNKKRILLGIPLFVIAALSSLEAENDRILSFIQVEGRVLHADSRVDEQVYINGYLSHTAQIDEFSLSSIVKVDEKGKALLDSSFRTVERIGRFYEWVSSENVRLEREPSGFMTVPADAARPVLRQVPTFPSEPIAPGDSWTAAAEEVHVLRINGTLYGPYRSTTQVLYTYREDRMIDGRHTALIDLEYSLYLPVRREGEPVRLISGQSQQQLVWDLEKGQPFTKTEDFEFLMMMSNGTSQEFVGRSFTEYRETESLDREGTAETLRNELGDDSGITVEPTGEGVLLSLAELDRILFEPESAELRAAEAQRLNRLAEILKGYSDRDILITGHTADYGTAAGRSRLSFERASAVADRLFPDGRKGRGKLFLRGAGSTEPTGTDRENRRVEILILD
ncbi:OmpA family protein [Spirochaeta isovalerica]|uniref:Outer membrane protein OmpA-like peptidoglycan-associated protein n=1 Tax=Spirochaeta isovalerica TaxID=150 RepID=A0A841RAQ2_9SPIO|nr:OmpA family protein [Spirochaeta isovalerica]MBB6480327.1 outer membrane protein OmpA-like peptidoglycan-associated protein [Spirochaeta isovalerica]